MKFLSSIFTCCVLLAGCAAPQPLGPQERSKIGAVRIDADVKRVPDMFYLPPGHAVGLMFGAVGGAITGASLAEPRQAMQAFVERNGIRIERIVSEELDAALRRSGKLPVVDGPADGAATIRAFVRQYGFGVPNALSSKVVPIVFIECSIVDPAGKTLWTSSDRVLTLGNPVEPVSVEELRDNPKLIESTWRQATKHIIANILGAM